VIVGRRTTHRGTRLSFTAAFSATAALVLAAGAPRMAEAAIDEHRGIELFVSNGVFGEPYITDQNGSDGVWRITGGALDRQELALRMEIEPPEYSLRIGSGPAVVFAGLTIDGGYGGDMGASQRVDTMGTAVLPACDDSGCVLIGEVRIPLDRLDDAMDAFTRVGTPVGLWLTVELTVVRTFGAGTWLQVLEFLGRTGIGTLGNPGSGRGDVWATVLFPSSISGTLGSEVPPELAGERYWPFVEELRRALFDDSKPLGMAPAFLHAELDPRCAEGHALLSAHSLGGDIVWSTDAYRVGELHDGFAVPVGVTHALTLHSQEGVVAGAIATGGAFVSSGTPVLVDARIDCPEDPGARRILATSSALVAASASAAPAWPPIASGSPTVATRGATPTTSAPPSAHGTLPATGAAGRPTSGSATLVASAALVAAALAGLVVVQRRRARGP
jgi:hypothetical protein